MTTLKPCQPINPRETCRLRVDPPLKLINKIVTKFREFELLILRKTRGKNKYFLPKINSALWSHSASCKIYWNIGKVYYCEIEKSANWYQVKDKRCFSKENSLWRGDNKYVSTYTGDKYLLFIISIDKFIISAIILWICRLNRTL